LVESLIGKRSAKLDMSKFEDGYEVALRKLVNAKVNHLPVPADEVSQTSGGRSSI
jgi:DNA end-binding protein Ku